MNAMCEAMANKILHKPLTELKKCRDEPQGAQLVASVRRLFDLDHEPSVAPVEAPKAEPKAESALSTASSTPGEPP
jgi:hypothetical protein